MLAFKEVSPIAVRFVKKSEEEYYEGLLNYSQSHMMLYPYHLSDIVVRGLRVTPFNYYQNMLVVSGDWPGVLHRHEGPF